jgi:exopolyphosphatase/guanosine-5'-triphosphate,3'-diphosphate pyrophosphatase
MYGVIDIGSNTIRLSVYKTSETGFKLMLNKKSTAGLVGYINKQGDLSQKGVMKAVSVIKNFDQILSNIGVDKVFVLATAALRNIGNTEDVVEKIKILTGYDIDVVSGEQEAVYSFTGAAQFLDLHDGIMIDIGGGSTELVFYKDRQIIKALSMPIGSLSLYNKHVSEILPTNTEIDEIRRSVRKELRKLEIEESYQLICGVGGTIRGTSKLNNAIFDVSVDNRVIEAKNVRDMLEKFCRDRRYAIRKIIKILPDRIHTIIPGMIILDSVVRQYNGEKIQVSEYGIREGYLYTKLFVEGLKNDGADKSGQAVHPEQGAFLAEV